MDEVTLMDENTSDISEATAREVLFIQIQHEKNNICTDAGQKVLHDISRRKYN